MGRTACEIEPKTIEFIQRQKMFFVATATADLNGFVNLSPKGLDAFRVVDSTTVVYLDLVGSGVETIAHLKENGRIVLMFCAFDGKPNIARIHGQGQVIEPHEEEFPALAALFPAYPGIRSIIRVTAQRVSNTCGFGVPLYDFVGEREELVNWAVKQGPDRLRDYQDRKNRVSLDGLPGVSLVDPPAAAE